ncbi:MULTISPECIES: hypothetical protein [unclassified Mesorhizobium]|uniref:hypothetical protein n=1 Tax=unclassified Mesorhizobium TaxID=325217 RepID=UPI000FD74FD2|nr:MULTISPECIES: hypothetical protein [unclassified Mesorhizobium]TGQ42692.1 hypothetical protein EN859_010765 [Mesorhizobium sp. M00.F.Ca.ET.216.01.1.1]TIS55147.1 MAG: hypothetical protein E5W91_23355 [Mesorhizobium sp.]TIS90083.1 MAG: hypothetical protein E5W89_14030 [Mesorhizobium sp.]TJW14533.1 MAG: hypothetical protein E5W82_11215 [Mesorhizobium sp.]TJW45777.1 MAG: hypothetical protein E5W83_10905 [Mesorhizobium sp.]
MKRNLIRYKTKPETADENERLVKDVFQELHAKSPDGVRYLSLRLGDGTFVHFVEVEAKEHGNTLPELKAFRSFQSGIKDRCAELPVVNDVTIVGNYRMLGE